MLPFLIKKQKTSLKPEQLLPGWVNMQECQLDYPKIYAP